MPFYIVMLGPPGAGKGTQAEILSEKLELAHVSTGAIFRENIKNESELGKQVQEILKRGDLVPDDVTNAIVEEYLGRSENSAGAVLDGYPRTPVQAEALDGILLKLGAKVDAVPCVEVPDEVLIDRLSGRWTCRANGHIFHYSFNPPKQKGICDFDASELYQREDDRRETVERRISVYLAQTAPLIDYYRKQGKLLEINGNQPIDAVTADLLQALPFNREGA